MRRWGSRADLFSIEDFYNNIVSTFEDNVDDPWVVETLDWWNT
jgi:hypothetical protein